jgi:hypothetical protein
VLQKEFIKPSIQILIRRSSSKKTRLQAAVKLLPANFRAKENFLIDIFHHVNTATR